MLIYKVLSYARETRYPTNRSAFTYIDEEQPSRLDFGKEKFGGPFTEEEVEDVKTVLRILQLLITTGAYLSSNASNAFFFQVIPTTFGTHAHNCMAHLQDLICATTGVLLIPAYRIILYPVFYNCIPSMMKRVGAGLFLCLVSTLINLTLDTVGHLHSNTTHCILDTNTDTFPIPLYWVLTSDTLYGIGLVVVTNSSAEFIMAQTPNRMRGVMVGLGFTSVGICKMGSKLLYCSSTLSQPLLAVGSTTT